MDKVWLAGVIKALDDKGVKAILVDYLIDTWSSDKEYEDLPGVMATVKAPVVVGVDPERRPGIDYKVVKGIHYADARALVNSDYDDIMRRYDPKPASCIRWRRGRAPDRCEGAAPRSSTSAIAAPTPPRPGKRRRDRALLSGRLCAVHAGAADQGQDRASSAASPARRRAMWSSRTTPTPPRCASSGGHEKGTPGVEVHAHALAQMIGRRHGHEARRLLEGPDRASPPASPARPWAAPRRAGGVVHHRGPGHLCQRRGCGVPLRRSAFMAPDDGACGRFRAQLLHAERLAAAELQSQRAFYSSTLERYLAPQVIDRMVDGSSSVTIGAVEREITVLISDLENFSNLVASLDLPTFTAVINEYLAAPWTCSGSTRR
jgi:hypothetical protein